MATPVRRPAKRNYEWLWLVLVVLSTLIFLFGLNYLFETLIVKIDALDKPRGEIGMEFNYPVTVTSGTSSMVTNVPNVLCAVNGVKSPALVENQAYVCRFKR